MICKSNPVVFYYFRTQCTFSQKEIPRPENSLSLSKKFFARGAYQIESGRYCAHFHKIWGHVPQILYKPLASVPERRAQTAEFSIGSVVPIERLSKNYVFRQS